MILGMSVETFTVVHVMISLVAIVAGIGVVLALLANRWLDLLNFVFLVTTILTSVTGFFFHSKTFGPPHIVGVVSLVVLAGALFALYGGKMAGRWRAIYVITATMALYLNCFVLVAQAFAKIEPLKALAPKGTEPPFAIAQGLVLIVFVVLGFLAVRRYRPTAS